MIPREYNLELHLGCDTVDWVILHWYACGADGWSGGRAYGHVVTKFSRMGRLLHFLTYGAPLSAPRERDFR